MTGRRIAGLVWGMPVAAALLLGSGPVAAQVAKPPSHLANIELCNRMDRTALETRINGCTALIDARYGTTTVLAIAHNNRGNAYIAKGDFDRAIEDFDRSIALDQTYAKPHNNRGVALMRKGEYGLAVEAFDEAIRLNPNYGNAYANRGGAYVKKADYARASRDYDEAVRLNPGLHAGWQGRCWAQAILGELSAALDACNRALESGLSHAATHDSLGLIHLKMDQPAEAIGDYSAALQLNPKLASAFYGRGLARLKTGDQLGGDADIAAAKALAADIGDEFARHGAR
jgi:tetratricopeptide (TPR) repeat protein